MAQVTYQSREMATRDAEQLRTRGERMLELATRAYCEQNYNFARLLTQLASEVFAHARNVTPHMPLLPPAGCDRGGDIAHNDVMRRATDRPFRSQYPLNLCRDRRRLRRCAPDRP